LGRGCGSNLHHPRETLTMSRKERDRLSIVVGITGRELRLRA
jgi:hypothetical protein